MSKNILDDVINFVAVRKSNPKDWAYLHVKLDEGAVSDIEKTLRSRFSGITSEIFVFDDKNEVVMVADNRGRQALNQFDKAVFERFGGGNLRVASNDLTDKGMEHLTKVLTRLMPDQDKAARISLARMSRPSNCILVLDDDPMVLKSLEMVLKGFGYVGLASTPEEFFAQYKEYAPNMVFVDIHLKNYKGTSVVKAVRSQFDPHVHSIMISADATADTVMSVKEAGAKGFIVKPFNRDAVYQHVLKAPTFVPKTI